MTLAAMRRASSTRRGSDAASVRLSPSARRIAKISLVPAFGSSCSTLAPTFHELRKVSGTSKPDYSSAALPFEVPEPNLPRVAQELQMDGASGVDLTFATHLAASS